MDSIIEIRTISDLNKMLNQEDPRHPLIGVLDFSKIDFRDYGEMKVSMGFYSIMLKNLCPGAMRYGRNYYDFRKALCFLLLPIR